jgi:hypothetical protein
MQEAITVRRLEARHFCSGRPARQPQAESELAAAADMCGRGMERPGRQENLREVVMAAKRPDFPEKERERRDSNPRPPA